MKRLLSTVAIITVVLSLFTTVAVADDTATDVPMKVIYLNSSHPDGKDSNSGTSTADPVVSIVRAFELLGDGGGIVCISGDTVIDHPEYTSDARTLSGWQIDCYPHTGKIYVTAINGARLIKDNDSVGTTFSLGGPVEFFNLTVQNMHEQNLNFYTYGHELVMGNGIVYEGNGSESKGWHLYGFTANNESQAGADINPVISVYSGTYKTVNGAGSASAGSVRGNSTINVYGGNITTVKAGGAGRLEGNQVLNIYKTAKVNKVTDQSVTGTVTCNLYGFTPGHLPVFEEDNSYIINNGVGEAYMPDSDLVTFEINGTPITDLPLGTDPESTETQSASDQTTPETDPEIYPETDPETEKPTEGGCGSTVAGRIAILAVISLAGAVLRKRD